MTQLTSELRTELVRIDSIRAHPGNARKHPKSQLRRLEASIREFGCLRPILVDAESRIIAGHALWQALKSLGHHTVNVIRADGLNEAQVRAYLIADNKLGELSSWDKEILSVELKSLVNLDTIDVTVTGFDTAEIDLIIQDGKDDAADAKEVEVGATVVTAVGDKWILDDHIVLCGDSRSRQSYEALLGDERARMVFTDPPYNVPIEGHVCGKGSIHHAEFAMASGEMDRDEFVQFLRTFCTQLCSFSEPGALHYLCMDWRHAEEILAAGTSAYRQLKGICVWAKTNAGMGSLYRSQHELVFVFKHGTAAHINNVQLGRFGRNRTNLWTYASPTIFGRSGEDGNLASLHPTVKPVAMVADAILDASNRQDIVLDPFLGSGTTLLAACRIGRRCRAIDIEPLYVDVAVRRWQQMTGGTAMHAESGKSFDELTSERGESR